MIARLFSEPKDNFPKLKDNFPKLKDNFPKPKDNFPKPKKRAMPSGALLFFLEKQQK